MTRRHPNVVNIEEIEPRVEERGKFGYKARRLGLAAAGRGLGCSYYEIAPGKQAFPHHFHCANEESTFILEGTGLVRIGDEKIPVKAGDYIAFPPGPAAAHSIRNNGNRPLKLLTISTMMTTEVVGYPDSKKVAAYSQSATTPLTPPSPWIRMLVKEQPNEDYYSDEDTGSSV